MLPLKDSYYMFNIEPQVVPNLAKVLLLAESKDIYDLETELSYRFGHKFSPDHLPKTY